MNTTVSIHPEVDADERMNLGIHVLLMGLPLDPVFAAELPGVNPDPFPELLKDESIIRANVLTARANVLAARANDPGVDPLQSPQLLKDHLLKSQREFWAKILDARPDVATNSGIIHELSSVNLLSVLSFCLFQLPSLSTYINYIY